MPETLTFVLAAPLAAMGGIAVGERRGSWDRPARSALAGLLGACLGIRRDDADGQAALAAYRFAVRVESPGTPMTDYHTAQVPPSKRAARYATRREELAADDLSTVLTWRTYRCDVAFLVAVLAPAGARWAPDALAEALWRPRFTPYLGRKSCPLALPMAPRLHATGDPVAALAERAAHQAHLPRPPRGFSPYVAVDADAGIEGLRVEHRRDVPLDRRRWQFGLRAEAIVPPGPAR